MRVKAIRDAIAGLPDEAKVDLLLGEVPEDIEVDITLCSFKAVEGVLEVQLSVTSWHDEDDADEEDDSEDSD